MDPGRRGANGEIKKGGKNIKAGEGLKGRGYPDGTIRQERDNQSDRKLVEESRERDDAARFKRHGVRAPSDVRGAMMSGRRETFETERFIPKGRGNAEKRTE